MFLLVRSPIERAFLAALVQEAAAHNVSLEVGDHLAVGPMTTPHIIVMAQQRVNRHRVDFLLRAAGVGAVVECDGHRWHTSKAAQREDRSFDRWCQRERMLLFRFTGTEISQNARHCAQEALGDVLRAVAG